MERSLGKSASVIANTMSAALVCSIILVAFMEVYLNAESFVLTISILAIVAVASLLSGIFGMAGGMILIGALVFLLDIITAMLLVTAILGATNAWRIYTWRNQVAWRIVFATTLGGFVAFILVLVCGLIPDKAIALIALGMPPLLVNFIPGRFWPNVKFVPQQIVCGFLFGLATLVGGAGAAITDMFFQKSDFKRTEIVATQAAIVLPQLILRSIFFAWVAFATKGQVTSTVDAGMYISAVLIAIASTSLGGSILRHYLVDTSHRIWSWRISIVSSVFFVSQAAWIMMRML